MPTIRNRHTAPLELGAVYEWPEVAQNSQYGSPTKPEASQVFAGFSLAAGGSNNLSTEHLAALTSRGDIDGVHLTSEVDPE